MNQVRKNNVALFNLVLLVVAFTLALYMLWPIIHPAAKAEQLEENPYSIELDQTSGGDCCCHRGNFEKASSFITP